MGSVVGGGGRTILIVRELEWSKWMYTTSKSLTMYTTISVVVYGVSSGGPHCMRIRIVKVDVHNK